MTYEDYVYYHLTSIKKFGIIMASLMQWRCFDNSFSQVDDLIFRGRNPRVNTSIVSFMFCGRYLWKKKKIAPRLHIVYLVRHVNLVLFLRATRQSPAFLLYVYEDNSWKNGQTVPIKRKKTADTLETPAQQINEKKPFYDFIYRKINMSGLSQRWSRITISIN